MLDTPRQFIRHPTDIPIEFSLNETDANDLEKIQMKDVGNGGLCFINSHGINTGEKIDIIIPSCDPTFKANGIVRWCKQDGTVFLVGVAFQEASVAFAVRMVEQVCHIENYRCQIKAEKGIDLTSEQAAIEWVSRYAHDFPESFQ